MRVFYISPSVMPSRSANSVHVARMCEAIASLGHEVTLLVNRSVPSAKGFLERIEAYYGVQLKGVRIVSFYSQWARALNFRIALLAAKEYLILGCTVVVY